LSSLGIVSLNLDLPAACGFATNTDQLIAFRTLQGAGGSGLYTLTVKEIIFSLALHCLAHFLVDGHHPAALSS
jgi:MFS family permease